MNNLRLTTPLAMLVTSLLLAGLPTSDAQLESSDHTRDPGPSRTTGVLGDKMVEHMYVNFRTYESCTAYDGSFQYKQTHFFLRMYEEPRRVLRSNRTKRSLLVYLDVRLDDYCVDPRKGFTFPYGCAKMRIDKDVIGISGDGKTATLKRALYFQLGACTGPRYYWNNQAPKAPETCPAPKGVPTRMYCKGRPAEIDDTCSYTRGHYLASYKGQSFDYSRYNCCTGTGVPLPKVTNQLSGKRVVIKTLDITCSMSERATVFPTCDPKRDSYYSLGQECTTDQGVDCDGNLRQNPPSEVYYDVVGTMDGKPLPYLEPRISTTIFRGYKVAKTAVCGSGGFCPAGSGFGRGGICA